MPGIVGIIRSDVSDEVDFELPQMLACLRHEPYYAADSIALDKGKLSLGWVGIDGHATEAMFAQSEDTCVALSGELFGAASEASRKNVSAGGHAQRVLQAYEADEVDCLVCLNGWFSGVIQDRRRKRLLLFNDRYGHGRLYWHQDATGFYFSSEAKALLALRPRLRSLDPQGLSEWLTCGCVLQNRTLFPDILLLPPASVWTFHPDRAIDKHTYFRPAEWEDQPELSTDEYLDKLEETLPGILKRYLGDKRTTAISLTGGLDGRLIMAWGGVKPGDLPCYTFNGPYRECADARLARRIAEASGQSHQVIPLEEDFFDNFRELAAKSVYLSDGTMDVTGAAELYLNRGAREIAPVRLTGNYGSEILREYVAFRPGKTAVSGIDSSLAAMMPQAAETFATEAQGSRLSFIAFKQVPWHHYARSSIERSQLTVRSPYLDNDLVSLAYQAPADGKSVTQLLRLISRGASGLGSIPNDRGVTYPGGSLSGRLKRGYHEFMAKAEYAYDYGMPQWLARIDHRLSGLHLERMFLGHQKFCHFRIWYRDRLADTIQEVLLDPSTLGRGVFNREQIEQMVGQHLEGSRNHTSGIHRLLTIEFVKRELIDEPRSPGCSTPTFQEIAVLK